MTSETEMPAGAKIKKLPLEEGYKDAALVKIKGAVKGNQFDPERVVLEKFEGGVLCFQAETVLTVVPKVRTEEVFGRVDRGDGYIVVEDAMAVQKALSRAVVSLSRDPEIVRHIHALVLSRDDQGFALDNDLIPLPFFKKKFVFFEPCVACKSTGQTTCLPCRGHGVSLCSRCNGAGMGPCAHCHGAQVANGPNGNKIACPACHGQGKKSCALCSQSGKIQCRVCRSKGVVACPHCKGNAWVSQISVMEIEARTAFYYPKEQLPERVVSMIEQYGATVREHADFRLSGDLEGSAQMSVSEEKEPIVAADGREGFRVPIPYEVALPHGHGTYSIDGKDYSLSLFGVQGQLVDVPPFLDDLLKDGMGALRDAADFRGDVRRNLERAAGQRTLKEGIVYAAMSSLGKAKSLLKRSNRIGLSDAMIDDIVVCADTALKNVTKTARTVGLVLSGVLNFTLFCLYFLSPVRDFLVSNIGNPTLHIFCDVLVLFASSYLGILSMQSLSTSTLRQLMGKIGVKRAVTPKLGRRLYWSIGLSVLLFISVLEISRWMDANVPFWYAALFTLQ